MMPMLPAATELIGVKGRVTRADMPSLKRAALLFDRMVLLETVTLAQDGTGVDSWPDDRENSRNLFRLEAVIHSLDDHVRSNGSVRLRDVSTPAVRELAVEISERYGCSAVPLVEGGGSLVWGDRFQSVVCVILEQLPLPTADTPWAAIWDWRKDEEARRMYARLRAWMNRAARSHEAIREVFDELISLLADYRVYMDLHHRHMRHGRIEMLLTTTAEVLESMATFRWSGAVKRLFDVKKSEIALLETELNAPGREVAYIDASHRRFDASAIRCA